MALINPLFYPLIFGINKCLSRLWRVERHRVAAIILRNGIPFDLVDLWLILIWIWAPQLQAPLALMKDYTLQLFPNISCLVKPITNPRS